MYNLCIIPARANSKRLKNKNILPLGSKFLIEWTIDFAKKISNKNFILLSTDSKRMLAIAKKNNILCPFLRPKYLSADHAKSADVCIHAIKWYEKKFKKKIKTIILLQPTSPFRLLSIYKKALKLYHQNFLPTFTVTQKKTKFLDKFSKDKVRFLYRTTLEANGNLYMISAKDLKKNKSFFSSVNNIVEIKENKKECLDIDTIYDYLKAKKILKKNL